MISIFLYSLRGSKAWFSSIHSTIYNLYIYLYIYIYICLSRFNRYYIYHCTSVSCICIYVYMYIYRCVFVGVCSEVFTITHIYLSQDTYMFESYRHLYISIFEWWRGALVIDVFTMCSVLRILTRIIYVFDLQLDCGFLLEKDKKVQKRGKGCVCMYVCMYIIYLYIYIHTSIHRPSWLQYIDIYTKSEIGVFVCVCVLLPTCRRTPQSRNLDILYILISCFYQMRISIHFHRVYVYVYIYYVCILIYTYDI